MTVQFLSVQSDTWQQGESKNFLTVFGECLVLGYFSNLHPLLVGVHFFQTMTCSLVNCYWGLLELWKESGWLCFFFVLWWNLKFLCLSVTYDVGDGHIKGWSIWMGKGDNKGKKMTLVEHRAEKVLQKRQQKEIFKKKRYWKIRIFEYLFMMTCLSFHHWARILTRP